MSTITTPARSLSQRRDALALANDVRSRRADLKRDLKEGRQQITPLLADPPAWLETAKVLDLLMALPRVADVKAHALLRRAGVSSSKSFGGLTERQRAALLALLGRRG